MRNEISHHIRKGTITREDGISELSLLCMDGEKPTNLNEFLDFVDVTEAEFDALIHKPISPQLLDIISEIENWLLGRSRLQF